MSASRSASVGARIRGVLSALIPPGALVVCLLGLAVRLTVRDRVTGGVNTFYYMTPPIVLAALALIAGGWWLWRKRWIAALPALALGIGCLVWSYQTTWFHHPPGDSDQAARVLAWNVARGMLGWSGVLSEIRQRDADVIGLVEAGRNPDAMRVFWKQHFPEYDVGAFKHGMVLLAKGKITLHRTGHLRYCGWFAHCEVDLGKGDPLHVVLVDFKANPVRTRRYPFDALYKVLTPLVDKPVLLMGDFNTPTDSVFFRPLRRYYSNAFELAGNGYVATWPMPLPVLPLDQAWFSPGILVNRCELGWTWASDHRPLELEVSLDTW